MENARDIQDWHTINCSISDLIKKCDGVVVEYNESRLEEYRNAILCLVYRQPLPIIYIAFNPTLNSRYKLFHNNSVFEAYALYVQDKFSIEDNTINGFYSSLDLSTKRRVDEPNVEARCFCYLTTEIFTQVKTMIEKLIA